jgi:hypothetical protein
MILQQAGKLGFVARSDVSDLHGGSSNTAGGGKETAAKSRQRE